MSVIDVECVSEPECAVIVTVPVTVEIETGVGVFEVEPEPPPEEVLPPPPHDRRTPKARVAADVLRAFLERRSAVDSASPDTMNSSVRLVGRCQCSGAARPDVAFAMVSVADPLPVTVPGIAHVVFVNTAESEHVKETAPLKPPTAEIVTALVVVPPDVTVRAAGEAEMLKSPVHSSIRFDASTLPRPVTWS